MRQSIFAAVEHGVFIECSIVDFLGYVFISVYLILVPIPSPPHWYLAPSRVGQPSAYRDWVSKS